MSWEIVLVLFTMSLRRVSLSDAETKVTYSGQNTGAKSRLSFASGDKKMKYIAHENVLQDEQAIWAEEKMDLYNKKKALNEGQSGPQRDRIKRSRSVR